MKGALLAGALALGVLALTPAAFAADARIGIRAETPSMDPHFSYAAPTKAAVSNIFDTLIVRDKDLKLTPALATEWAKVGPATWEFKLRPGVTWHDGEPFTAEDVIFTFGRAGNVPNSPAPFTQFLPQIVSTEKIDDLTLRIHTANESTQLLMDLSEILIVSKHAGENATTEDYNSGKATIGTGPYKFVSWQPGAPLVLERYDGYWGTPAALETVDIIPIPNNAGRVAALLAGDVDLIDAVPPDSVDRLRGEQGITVWAVPDVYTAFLHMDSDRDVSPGITAKDGSPIPNPLLDKRVREALALAIDRDAIISRLMFGLGEKASQLSSPTMIGYNPDIPQTPYDPEKAKALLAEAGYPDGFSMTIAGPNDRYVADGQITQAVAQMFERVGLKMQVDTMPSNVFMSKASAQEFSIFFIAFGTAQATTWSNLRAVLMTYNKDAGTGTSNRGRYSNPEVDRLAKLALEASDIETAAKNASEAAAIAFGDYAIIPLHHQMNVWAGRQGFTYEARQDSLTLAYGLSKTE
jgi:peptide/nickel transport system substrate-binding protein